MQSTFDSSISIRSIPGIQFIAVADPFQPCGANIVQQLEVEVTRQSEDGVNTQLDKSSEEVFRECGGFGGHCEG